MSSNVQILLFTLVCVALSPVVVFLIVYVTLKPIEWLMDFFAPSPEDYRGKGRNRRESQGR